MALVKRQSNSSRTVAVLAVAVVVVGVGYFLVKQYFSGGSGVHTPGGSGGGRRVITNFGESILNDPRYTGLQTFGTNISADANLDAGQPEPFQ